MDRNPSDENADDDAANESPEPELENDTLSDPPDETVTPPDNDGSSSEKNVINDSEPEPECPPDADSEPNVENVADEQEQAPDEQEEAPEEKEPEEPADEPLPEEIEPEDDITEKVENDEQEQEASPTDIEAETQPLDEKLIAGSIIEQIDEIVKSGSELTETDSGEMGLLAVGIVTTIIKSSIVPSDTELSPREPGDEMDSVPEGVEVAEMARAEDEDIFSTPYKFEMVDKAVQAIAREIDEELEALSVESLPLEEDDGVQNIESVESCVISEGEPYQTCEEISDAEETEDMPCGEDIGLVPCPDMEQTDEERQAVDMEDDSQWEDLLADEEAVIPSEPQDTPIAQEEEFAPVVQRDEYAPTTAPQVEPPPSEAPTPVKRRESSDGITPAPPPAPAIKPRAVVSDTQRRGADQSAVTPKREPREGSDWQQAIRELRDQLLETPYDYIVNFVLLCVAIRSLRNIIAATRCG